MPNNKIFDISLENSKVNFLNYTLNRTKGNIKNSYVKQSTTDILYKFPRAFQHQLFDIKIIKKNFGSLRSYKIYKKSRA